MLSSLYRIRTYRLGSKTVKNNSELLHSFCKINLFAWLQREVNKHPLVFFQDNVLLWMFPYKHIRVTVVRANLQNHVSVLNFTISLSTWIWIFVLMSYFCEMQWQMPLHGYWMIYTEPQKKRYKVVYWVISSNAITWPFYILKMLCVMVLRTNAKFEPGSVKRNFWRSIWMVYTTCTISLLSGIIKVKNPVRSRGNIPKQVKKSSEIDNKTHTFSSNILHNTLKSSKSSNAFG